MKISGIVLMVCLTAVQLHAAPDTAAVVNEPVTLPCNCSGQVVAWTIFYPTKESIAVCRHGMCLIEQHFQKKFSVMGNTSAGNFSMTINSTLYNDVGYYRCTCNLESVSEVKLKVYDPRVVRAFEGQNITLPCYGDTRQDANDVQWKKDGRILLEYRYAVTEEAFRGRFTISKEGFLDGDLSLHINSVQPSDAALYLCLIHGESREGDPRAVLLKVEESQPEHQPPTYPINYTGIALGVTLLLLFLLIGVTIYCLTRCIQPHGATPTNPGPPVQEETPMIPKCSSTQPIQD